MRGHEEVSWDKLVELVKSHVKLPGKVTIGTPVRLPPDREAVGVAVPVFRPWDCGGPYGSEAWVVLRDEVVRRQSSAEAVTNYIKEQLQAGVDVVQRDWEEKGRK